MSKICSSFPADRMKADALLRGVPEDEDDEEDEEQQEEDDEKDGDGDGDATRLGYEARGREEGHELEDAEVEVTIEKFVR